jgi:hypothetical protein
MLEVYGSGMEHDAVIHRLSKVLFYSLDNVLSYGLMPGLA